MIVAVSVGAGFSVGGMVMTFGRLDGVGSKVTGEDSVGGGVEHEANKEHELKELKKQIV